MPSADLRVIVDLLAHIISLGGLRHLVKLAGQESFARRHILGEVRKNGLSRFLH